MRALPVPAITAACVLACLLGSALPLGAASRGRALPTGPAPALELEADLAGRALIYVVIDTGAPVLEVRSRGMRLERVPLDSAVVVRRERLLGSSPDLALELPAIWSITYRDGVTAREIITPRALEPYPEDGEETARPAAKRVTAKPPARYHVLTDSGWAVAFDRRVPGQTLFARLAAAVESGWQRVLGVDVQEPPTLALALAAEESERLHHLLRPGTPILVLPPPAVEGVAAAAVSPP